MRRDLANARMGQLVGADWRTYSLRTNGIEPTEVEALIEAGWPVVTYFAGGRLVWHDEDDAWPAWADARSAPEFRSEKRRRAARLDRAIRER